MVESNIKIGLKVFIILIIILPSKLFSQVISIDTKYFRSPIDTAILLSGNFAELRPNHFHGGLDIRTGGKEGKNIYAIADGYVSRISISSVGYGKALHINHLNGLRSVYAHLQSFNPTIEKYINEIQYSLKEFEVDTTLPKNLITVKKGDIIALSGNSGSSEGPHLHFEIRDSLGDITYNPLLFGFKLEDNSSPTLQNIYIYPASNNSNVNGKNATTKINALKNAKIKNTVTISGKIGIGVEGFDTENNSQNKNGIYSIRITLDDSSLIYSYQLDKVAFNETRCINSHIDYKEKLTSGKNIHKCFLQENNFLKIYTTNAEKGLIELKDTLVHYLTITAKDFFGNSTYTKIRIINNFSKNTVPVIAQKEPYSSLFKYNEPNKYVSKNIMLEMPKNNLYENINFSCYAKDSTTNFLQTVYHIHNKYVPVHDYYQLSLKLKNNNYLLKDKLVISSLDFGNKGIKDCKCNNDFLTCNVRSLGKFKISLDSIKPSIKAISIREGKNMRKENYIAIKVWDNLSGIKKYFGSIDGDWIKMEYDKKNNLLFYKIEKEKLTEGKHLFKLEVTDDRLNKNSYEANFIW